jgi:exopolyphosphatase / guanosine-5'-triphosphate,3'-diphosphate pyrophosphatase
VACGGNAEALARLAPGPRVNAIETLNLRLLGERLWSILRLDVRGRMRTFGVRRDRAEVMGIGAIVLTTLGNWLGLRSLLVPGVGVREGILGDLAFARFSAIRVRPIASSSPVLREARRFAARMHSDSTHIEQVRRLAVSLFDQLLSIHDLPTQLRLLLEVSALLHDVGYAVNPKAHHKHGEYLARHARISGLDEQQRILMACLVRYHGTSEPEPDHKLYSALDTGQREQVRLLAAILRIAVALDESRQSVDHVEVTPGRKEVRFELHTNSRPAPAAAVLRRAASFFQREFGTKVRFVVAREQSESTLLGQGKGSPPLQAA